MVDNTQHMPDGGKTGAGLAARLRANAAPLALGLGLALVSLPAGLQAWQAIMGYGIFAAALLFWPSGKAAARARAEIKATRKPYPDFAVIEALDLPAVIFDQDTQVVCQNAAARELVGVYPERASLSARIRSPAILDLVSRVIARGLTESIEHTNALKQMAPCIRPRKTPENPAASTPSHGEPV